MRKSEIKRKTTETEIQLSLNLDGRGTYEIHTDCGFFNHMLELFTRHGRFDLKLQCKGDSHVDFHHTVEDVGIALGQAVKAALGDKKGIVRYGSMMLPMDEALVLTSLDISGRATLAY
ncbi:MAG: imidazoleglycerol-phosphate dehydratase, partial [Anaerovoracaceae bacterium]